VGAHANVELANGGYCAGKSRSDVSPVAVNVFAVDGASAPVATDTNAFSMTYGKDGQRILFANGDASGPDFAAIPFAVRTGCIYSVATPGGAGTKPPALPTPLFTKQGSYYSDISALDSGAVAFTAQGADGSSKVIQVLDEGSSVPRTTVTDVAAAAHGLTWGAGDFVAYLDTSPESSLVVSNLDNRSPRRVDTGVDAFAWAPRSR
jgi:TolB protein